MVELPKQFPSEEEALTIETIASISKTAIITTVVVPFALQFALKTILNKTWPLLNQL